MRQKRIDIELFLGPISRISVVGQEGQDVLIRDTEIEEFYLLPYFL